MVPEFESDNVREVLFGPYRIWYTVTDQAVTVIAVFHGARDTR